MGEGGVMRTTTMMEISSSFNNNQKQQPNPNVNLLGPMSHNLTTTTPSRRREISFGRFETGLVIIIHSFDGHISRFTLHTSHLTPHVCMAA
jgi:hypothetical protein